jgi:diguanylate cyclase (GGDEF)-like protein
MVPLAPVRLVVSSDALEACLQIVDIGVDDLLGLATALRGKAKHSLVTGEGAELRTHEISDFGGWFVLEAPIVLEDGDVAAQLILARQDQDFSEVGRLEAKVLADVIALAINKRLGDVNRERRIYLEDLVRGVAEECMAATEDSLADVYSRVIKLLGEEFGSDVAFLRRNDYVNETSVLVGEWPEYVMENGAEHPLGVVAFDSDPIFMVTRDLKKPLFKEGDEQDTGAIQEKIERAAGVPGVTACAVPLLMGEHTWGIIGFLHFEAHTWLPAEVNALTSVASLLTQLQGRFDAIYEAGHDDLTGMHNRRALLAELDARLEKGEPTAVMVIDLDRFKVMNDFLGHAQGDKLLVTMAERVFDNTRPGDFAGRLGGDEFVFVVGSGGGGEEALGLARRLLGILRQPTDIGDQSVSHTASIGVAVSTPGMSSFDLLAAADVAMYSAKNAGGDRAALYNDELRNRVNNRSQIEMELSEAMRSKELELYYQPEVNLETGEIVGMEALVRWQHPTRGLVAAWEFIPVAEETGLIVEIDRWVMAEACRQMSEWRRAGGNDGLVLRVNVSPASLRRDDFVEDVLSVLLSSGLPATSLCLEITEHVIVMDPQKTAKVLERLREIGVTIAIDDFGTGFASLAELKNLPADFLKLDIGFVRGIIDNRFDRAIVEAVVHLGETLEMGIVAEGIETQEMADELIAMGCTRAQGWLFYPALAVADMELLLDAAVRV